jgi:hypothetical protein
MGWEEWELGDRRPVASFASFASFASPPALHCDLRARRNSIEERWRRAVGVPYNFSGRFFLEVAFVIFASFSALAV